MHSLNICLLVFACSVGGLVVGMYLRSRLPGHHLKDESRDVLKTASGMIATLVALILGLLVASAKGTFDMASDGINQSATRMVLLDRVLARYGPEAEPVRQGLAKGLAAKIAQMWPENEAHKPVGEKAKLSETSELDQFERAVRSLTPKTDDQRYWQGEAEKLTADMVQSRWTVFMQAQNELPTVFLVVLIFWLAALYTSLGLLTPQNATAWAALLLCAASVSGALFLVMEMNRPLDGFIKVSDIPLRKAMEIINK